VAAARRRGKLRADVTLARLIDIEVELTMTIYETDRLLVRKLNVAIRNGMLVRGKISKHYYGIDMPHFGFAVSR
jgi:hypothetical protein